MSQPVNSKHPLPYQPPRLIEFGSISKLTQGAAGTGGDGGAMQTCL